LLAKCRLQCFSHTSAPPIARKEKTNSVSGAYGRANNLYTAEQRQLEFIFYYLSRQNCRPGFVIHLDKIAGTSLGKHGENAIRRYLTLSSFSRRK